MIMEQLNSANAKLKAAHDNRERDYANEIAKLDEEERRLRDRLTKLEEDKRKSAKENGSTDTSDDDLIEINAGGKVIAAKRGVLTQINGTRMEALFSGRWDKKLLRDSRGRIFLDFNPKAFQAIVDYMNELAISSEDDLPDPPHMDDDEFKYILDCQLALFRLKISSPQPDSNIITNLYQLKVIRRWLREDGSGGDLKLLYRSSRDGCSGISFHSKCNNKSRTLVIIQTTGGEIIGGYTNTPWEGRFGYRPASKAFLFALNGDGPPCKMRLKNMHDECAICDNGNYGPIFGGGHDLYVNGSLVTLKIGHSYDHVSFGRLRESTEYNIREMEVFQVSDDAPLNLDPRKRKISNSTKGEAVNIFTDEINEAINDKWTSLNSLEDDVTALEQSFKDEELFIQSLSQSQASGEKSDYVTLNVSGTTMVTKRATLMFAEDSVLAQQFDDTKWTEQGNAQNVKEWTPDEVTNWVKRIEGIPDDIAGLFGENEINGLELLALDKEGLKMLGVQRVGTICLLFAEIIKLEQTVSQDVVTLIEHSPYCFGKILDYLRLKQLNSVGLLEEEPAFPTVHDSQKNSFTKIVKYYFPGDSSMFILGTASPTTDDTRCTIHDEQFEDDLLSDDDSELF